jgi:hypothetical protein
MGEVQSSYIHPDINQSAQHLFAIARRPYGRYNFGPLRRSTHFSILAKAHAEDKAEERRAAIVSEGSSLCQRGTLCEGQSLEPSLTLKGKCERTKFSVALQAMIAQK